MEIEVREHTCPTKGCGITFWTTDHYDDRRRDKHDSFYCPNGHTMSYPGQTDAQKLAAEKKEADRLRGERLTLLNRITQLEKRRRRPPAKKPARKSKR